MELLLTRDRAPAERPPPRGRPRLRRTTARSAKGTGVLHRAASVRLEQPEPQPQFLCLENGFLSPPPPPNRLARDPRTSPRGTRTSLPSPLHLVSVWGLGSPGAQSPMPVSHTHHPEAEVLRAGRGRCAAPMGRQRQHKQQWRQPGLRAWRTRSPGGSRSPRAASHPALAGRVARVPAAASSQLRASLGSAPAPLRSAGLSRAPARLRGRAMLMYANRRRPAHSLKGAPPRGRDPVVGTEGLLSPEG